MYTAIEVHIQMIGTHVQAQLSTQALGSAGWQVKASFQTDQSHGPSSNLYQVPALGTGGCVHVCLPSCPQMS